MTEPAVLSHLADGVLELTLNRPDKFNALTEPMAAALVDLCKQAARNPEVRCLLISGAGRGFCAGQDLSEVHAHMGEFSFREHLVTGYNRLILALRELEKPVVAAVNGPCAGAGLGLALACDIRYASERARFLTAFVGIGLAPDSGVSYWLPRLVGAARAAELLFTNDALDGARAAEVGLVNKVVPHDNLLPESRALALRLAAGPTRAIGLTKRVLNRSLGVTLAETLEYEAAIQDVAGRSADYREGVASFLEKRKPAFRGA